MFEVKVGVELEFYSKKPKGFFRGEVKEEMGEGQLELVIPHSSNIPKVLKEVLNFKKEFKESADFRAYHLGLPSSALQFNISVHKQGLPFVTPQILHHLLMDVKPGLPFFAPTENCLLRLTDLQKIKEFRNSPYTLCVGDKNNRTAAIRLIENRIEHRVPSASCLVIKSFRSILNSISKGLSETEEKHVPIIYANAFEEEVIALHTLELIKESGC